MIIVYAILESPHRWSILAGASLGGGILGTVMIITYGWSHWLARIWFLAGLAIALYCTGRLILQLKAHVDQVVESSARPVTDSRNESA